MNEDYFDLPHLVSDWDGVPCPARGCTGSLDTAPSRWGPMPYCPVHGLRIHAGSRTFVYYNGADRKAEIAAALRNIRFNTAYFESHILGNSFKAETDRISHETSEDALTWNVLSQLASQRRLARVVGALTGQHDATEPELYLWGLQIALDDPSPSPQFQPLLQARTVFECGIRRFKTEPDIVLYVPGRFIIVVEAKFTSGNPFASTGYGKDQIDEKPRSIGGLLARYRPAALTSTRLITESAGHPFYEQLYRNLVFAIHMAEQLRVGWYLVNLVSKRQFANKHAKEFANPTSFIRGLLPPENQERFRFASWEELHDRCIRGVPELASLGGYLTRKTAYTCKALDV